MVQQPVRLRPTDIKRMFPRIIFEGLPCVCAYEICDTVLSNGDQCMLEVDTNLVYCLACGPCARYERKKALERELQPKE